jgi:hypothetical protein
MSCEAQVFKGIGAAQYAALIVKAKAAGIEIAGTSGHASKDGATVSWGYDIAAETLTLTCTGKPWWASCQAVSEELAKLVKEATA